MAISNDARLRHWYRLLAVRMTRFDCGTLCAPRNGGVPCCCDPERAMPMLFPDEFRMHRRRDAFWRPLPTRTRAQRREAVLFSGFRDVAARCPGASRCERDHRALVCRTYPFEPHLHESGALMGLTFRYADAISCPLMRLGSVRYNPAYIRNALRYWSDVLAAFDEEPALYGRESDRLRRRFAREGRRIPLYVVSDLPRRPPAVRRTLRRHPRRYCIHVQRSELTAIPPNASLRKVNVTSVYRGWRWA